MTTFSRRAFSASVLASVAFVGCAKTGGSWMAAWRRNLRKPTSLALRAPEKFVVLFETTKGNFEMEVTRAWSPLGADRFYSLVVGKFYDGARFFRVVPKFVVQFGISPDPAISAAWKKTEFADDPVTQSNLKGMVTFATGGPNTRTTQIFINKVDNARLDARGFSPFGRILSGMPVIETFEAKYGEGPPRGTGPEQEKMEAQGDDYVRQGHADLDLIKRARVIRVVEKPTKPPKKTKTR